MENQKENTKLSQVQGKVRNLLDRHLIPAWKIWPDWAVKLTKQKQAALADIPKEGSYTPLLILAATGGLIFGVAMSWHLSSFLGARLVIQMMFFYTTMSIVAMFLFSAILAGMIRITQKEFPLYSCAFLFCLIAGVHAAGGLLSVFVPFLGALSGIAAIGGILLFLLHSRKMTMKGAIGTSVGFLVASGIAAVLIFMPIQALMMTSSPISRFAATQTIQSEIPEIEAFSQPQVNEEELRKYEKAFEDLAKKANEGLKNTVESGDSVAEEMRKLMMADVEKWKESKKK